MGEEQKKQVEEKKEEAPKAEKEKPIDHENKEEKKAEETKDSSNKESKEPPPPPPPQEIVLQVYMHCEGCARKVRRCLKGFEGVEDVQTDCKTNKVVVMGDKADPLKVLERVQRKSHRQAVLLSPIPKPPAEEPKKPEDEKDVVKAEEKKEEQPQVIIVVLSVHMHCEACAQEIKKLIQRMKGVESAEPDLKSSQVTVKGVFEPSNLVKFIYKRTGKQAKIVKVEPEKKEEKKPKEGNEEKKAEEGGGEGEAKKGEQDGGKENKGGGGGGGDGGEQQPPPPPKEEAEQQEDPKVELRKNEFYYYHPHNYQLYPQKLVQQELYAYPPQIFSDENPNACSVM